MLQVKIRLHLLPIHVRNEVFIILHVLSPRKILPTLVSLQQWIAVYHSPMELVQHLKNVSLQHVTLNKEKEGSSRTFAKVGIRSKQNRNSVARIL